MIDINTQLSGYCVRINNEVGEFDLIDRTLAQLYPDINIDELPELSISQYQQWCGRGNQTAVYKNGELILQAKNSPAINLAQAKAAKLVELNAAAQAFVNQAADLDSIPDFELQTWPLQSAEAQAWAADNTAATPVLDRIAAARGMEPDKLKAAALRKALAYSALSAHVAGQRQALQSKIGAAKTVDALDKIKIEFTAPPEAT
ncbi:hypothetical protein GJU80_10665 [Neisseria brasiliensis]|uniref:Uncharacterized protein n=2 Tax=Neisseria TaxID=482 RepID=A0A7X2H1G4_9NEIS|nr:hypothetical protein [Neisseria brasiliensis]MRN38922.1 hypothetical protein [Neisseria brasiliensis]